MTDTDYEVYLGELIACEKCGSTRMAASRIRECQSCPNNGYIVWTNDDKDYHYEHGDKEVYRGEVEDTSSCAVGEAYDGGCMIFKCSICGNIQNIAYMMC